MAKTLPRTILLKGRGVRFERKAGGTITPGHLVMLNSSDQLVVNTAAKGKVMAMFAVEAENLNPGGANTNAGGGIDDNYVANDYCQAEVLHAGDEVNAIVAAGAAALIIGDRVEAAGDGTVRKLTPFSQLGSGTYAVTTEGAALGVVLKAVDNSGGSDPARVQIVLI